jgi:hypothetical protein
MFFFHAAQQAHQIVIEGSSGRAAGLLDPKGRRGPKALPCIVALRSLSIGRLTRIPLPLATHLQPPITASSCAFHHHARLT